MSATATLDRPTTSRPRRLSALEQANRVRLARAAIKRQIADGALPVTWVLREVPAEARGMTLGELLIAQRRWGQTRCRRLLAALDLGEHKPVGRLTDRQRQALLKRLDVDDEPSTPRWEREGA